MNNGRSSQLARPVLHHPSFQPTPRHATHATHPGLDLQRLTGRARTDCSRPQQAVSSHIIPRLVASPFPISTCCCRIEQLVVLRRVEVLAILFRLRRAAGHHGAEQEPRGEEAEGERLDLRPEWVPPREGPKRHRAGAGEPGSRRVRGTAPGDLLRSTKEQQPFCFRSGAHAVQPAIPHCAVPTPSSTRQHTRQYVLAHMRNAQVPRVRGVSPRPGSSYISSSEAATLSTVHCPLSTGSTTPQSTALGL
eukprot:scaffold28321_cov236-Isochrysis_galbana.AAC.2